MKEVFTDILNDYYNSVAEEDISEELEKDSIRKQIENDQVVYNKKLHKKLRIYFE